MGVASGRVTKSSHASSARAQLRDNFAKRPFAEQKLALNLAQLAQKEADLGLDGDRVQALVYGLTVSYEYCHSWMTSALTMQRRPMLRKMSLQRSHTPSMRHRPFHNPWPWPLFRPSWSRANLRMRRLV